MVGANGGPALQRYYLKQRADKKVVERQARQARAGIKGVEKAVPKAHVVQLAGAGELVHGARSVYIVEVAGYDGGPLTFSRHIGHFLQRRAMQAHAIGVGIGTGGMG